MDTTQQQPPLGVLIISAVLAALLQLVVAPVITIFGVVPNFILVVVVVIAFHNSTMRSTITGFVLGLFFDLCSLGPIGSMTLVLTILAYAVSSLNKGSFSGGVVVNMIVLLAAVALGEFLVSVIYAVTGVNPQFLLSLVQRVLPAIAYDAIIGFVFVLIYDAVVGRLSSNSGGGTFGGGGFGGGTSTTGRSLSRKLNR